MPGEIDQTYSMDQDAEAGQTVRAVAAEVFETMFFTEAEPAGCEHSWLPPAPCARIRFDGSHTGEMLLALSPEAAAPIAAGFLGLDPEELTDALRRQVIEEMSNILCGAMLSRLWPESTLALAAPQSLVWEQWPPGGTLHVCFQIPEGMVAVSLRLTAVN